MNTVKRSVRRLLFKIYGSPPASVLYIYFLHDQPSFFCLFICLFAFGKPGAGTTVYSNYDANDNWN